MSAVLVYSCFREQIPHYYSFIDEVAGIKDKRNKFFKEFKEKAKDVNLTDKKQVIFMIIRMNIMLPLIMQIFLLNL